MKALTKYKIILCCIFSVLSVKVTAQMELSKKQIIDVYRQYTLARCIYFAFGEEKVFSEDVSISVYYAAGLEFQDTNHSQKLDSLAKKMINEISPTEVSDYGDRKPILFECIKYYESQTLKKEILKILKIPRKDEAIIPKNRK